MRDFPTLARYVIRKSIMMYAIHVIVGAGQSRWNPRWWQGQQSAFVVWWHSCWPSFLATARRQVSVKFSSTAHVYPSPLCVIENTAAVHDQFAVVRAATPPPHELLESSRCWGSAWPYRTPVCRRHERTGLTIVMHVYRERTICAYGGRRPHQSPVKRVQ